MKKAVYRIYGGIFFALLLIPLVGMLFYRERDVNQKQALAPFPRLQTADGEWNVRFLPELGDYFSDHFAFRWEIIQANSLIKGKVFGMSGEDSVIQGRDGYYFYENSLDSYLGKPSMDERELFGTARTLALIQEYVKEQGGSFAFTVAPNKNTLYPQYMPYYYKKIQEDGDLERLQEKLKEQGVVYADLKAAFLAEEEVLYHRLDSHWNNKGAALAMGVILDALGQSHTDYGELPYQTRRDFGGDLYEMVYPLGHRKDENVYYEKEFDFSYGEGFKSTEDMTIRTSNGKSANKHSAVVFRDSFGNSLTPFLAQEYSRGYFDRTVPYPADMLEAERADTLIFEIVERHLGTLAKDAPRMPAPVRDYQEWGQQEMKGATMEAKETEDYVKIQGTLPENGVDADSEVYVRCVSAEHTAVYEAFPLSGKTDGGYRYEMYLAKDMLEPGTYIMEALCKKDGAWVTSGYIHTYTKG